MAKGFSENAQNPQAKAPQGNPERVNYQGKTAEGYANMAAGKTAEQRMSAINDPARREAYLMTADEAFLTSRYRAQLKADGTFHNMVREYEEQAVQAENEQRQRMLDQINGFFEVSEVNPENFTNSLKSSSERLSLTGS